MADDVFLMRMRSAYLCMGITIIDSRTQLVRQEVTPKGPNRKTYFKATFFRTPTWTPLASFVAFDRDRLDAKVAKWIEDHKKQEGG